MRALKATGLTYEGKTICGQVVVSEYEEFDDSKTIEVRILPKHASIQDYEGMDIGERVKPSSVIVYVNGQEFRGLFSNYED